MISRRLLLLLGAFSTLVHANLTSAPVLKIMRAAPIFEKPSAKSKLLAEADPETPILGRALSRQGHWILVEDSDGEQGWVPTARTNYSQISMLKDQLLPVNPSWQTELPEVSNLDDAPMEQVPKISGPRNWELSAAYREGLWENKQTVYPLGLSFIEARDNEGLGLRADIDLGSGAGALARAWRVSFVGRTSWLGSFFRELDIGYERQNTEPSLAALSLGYGVGFSFTPRLAASLRGGLFWGSKRQWNGEFRCRFAF